MDLFSPTFLLTYIRFDSSLVSVQRLTLSKPLFRISDEVKKAEGLLGSNA